MSRSASPVFLRSKLEPPRVFGVELKRPRVLTPLAPETVAGVSLIHAPAGFRKTTLLREGFLDRPKDKAAWVTLDAADKDPGRLVVHLLAALGDGEGVQSSETIG